MEPELRICYLLNMQQDPGYLEAQSRQLHARHRRNEKLLNVSVLLWSACSAALVCAALIDGFGAFGWGLTDDAGVFIGALAIGAGFWIFGKVIQKMVLLGIQHNYGPEPANKEA